MMDLIVLAAYGGSMSALGWSIICNERTLRQRSALRSFIKQRGRDNIGEWARLHAFFLLVDYDSHKWRLFFFRDPKYLYHFSLWDGFK